MRTNIFKSYKKYLNDGEGLKQQLFLEKYVNEDSNIDRLLLYHGIGTGKTRTSILICEALMKKNNKIKVNVILPARLKTNYIDELIILLGIKDLKTSSASLSLISFERYTIICFGVKLFSINSYSEDFISNK